MTGERSGSPSPRRPQRDEAAHWARVESLFAAALKRPADERKAFLDRECPPDSDLRREVEELLVAHDRTGLFDDVVVDDAASETESALPPGTRIGPFEIWGLLGRGGMGVVYEAHRADGVFEQTVALKVLPAGSLSVATRARFRAERQILARLSHPNVARLLDGGVEGDGRPWFAMELVRGTPILDYCDRNRMGVQSRLDLFLTVCEAVQYAHQSLIVHRDLKPGNIFVGGDGAPKLLDFGIAKALDPEATGAGSEHTQIGLRMLTPAYAAPEQMRGEPANTASDIYQLGILLYELLTGRHPFADRCVTGPAESTGGSTGRRDSGLPTPPSSSAMTAAAASARGRSPGTLSQRLRGDLDAIVMKALREEPERRYASAVEMAEDIRRHLARRPVRARADSWIYRSGRFVRRNAVALTVAAVMVTGATAFVAGMAGQARRTAIQRDRAEAVSDFMAGLFVSASPYASAGQDLSASTLLDRGAERARTELGDQPVVKASLLDVIGDAYWDLGLQEEGLAAREEALEEWRRQAAGSADYRPDLVVGIARAGRYLAQSGKAASARERLEEAGGLLPSLPADGSWDRADALNSLGLGWQMLGDVDRAEPLMEAALIAFREQGEFLAAATALGNLAWIRAERQDPDSAEALFREALSIRREGLGPDHPILGLTLDGLGDVLLDRGETAGADSAFRESLRVREAGLPEGHWAISNSTIGIARAAAGAGRVAEADSLFRLGIAGLEAGVGVRNAGVGNAHVEYAIFLQEQWRIPEAVEEFRLARESYAGALGEEHPSTAVVETSLGWALFLSGRPEDAVGWYEGALPRLRARDTVRGDYRWNHVNYGIVLCNADRQAEGIDSLRAAAAALGDSASGVDLELRARNALGQCLGFARRLDEAEEVLLGVMAATEGRPPDDPYRAFARQTLVSVYDFQGRTEEARRLEGGAG